jgi:hypothetical protein
VKSNLKQLQLHININKQPRTHRQRQQHVIHSAELTTITKLFAGERGYVVVG